MSNEHTMPDEHAAILRTLVGIGEADELSESLVDEYWSFKRCFDRVQIRITDRELAIFVWTVGHGKPIGDEGQADLVALARAKQIGYDTRCEVLFRKEWRPGRIVKHVGKADFIVQLDGDSEERKFDAAKLRLAESKELATV